jgi:hemerythrin-like metal-binding protein
MSEKSPWRLEWNEGLSVHIPEIDAEHQRFLRLIYELNEAIIGRMDVEEIKKRMRSLLDDAVKHFAHEEALFREWGYSEADEHAIKHEQAIQSLNQIMGHFERGGMDYEWIDAGLKVKEILIGHMLNEDMKYRDYFEAKGIRPGAA